MAASRLKQLLTPANTKAETPYPFDPLSAAEIEAAVEIVRKDKGPEIAFNAVTLYEPRKDEMLAWLAEPVLKPRPSRIADVVAIGRGTGSTSKVYDGLVDLEVKVITQWDWIEGVQPLITMDDLKIVEDICRNDAKVIEQCGIIGIPPTDMHKVYCDPWSIGYDTRFGKGIRLQQALMYYRPHIDDSQYNYPLDFCPIFNADTRQIIHIDIPTTRRPLSKAPPSNFHAAAIEKERGFRPIPPPIETTQPKGVAFTITGREINWQNWNLHVGFNYREGIVLNNITFHDKDQSKTRSIIWRLSLAEMVVPYGNPEISHARKHALDIGEYGCGAMTNSLTLGCDCKGAIHYMDASFANRDGSTQTTKNAICIHEEDSGILFKHTDFRDDSCTVTRGRKLIISQIFTAANYEYCIYWSFHQDGTIGLEIKLTGILNTYALNPGEDAAPWGTRVYPGVNAHNHQHLFCLRIDPNIDGPANSIVQSDATASAAPVGSAENTYGNAFFAQRTLYKTAAESVADYDAGSSRTWDMINPNKLNKNSGMPVSYKLVSREVPRLMPKEGSVVARRAGFAKHAVHVTRYADDQLHPAGRHVPQTSGDPNPFNTDLPGWIAAHPNASIDNTDVVLYHTFGITHFAAPEDWPVMPAEPITVMLRPRHFFDRNPALDVPPSHSSWPSSVAKSRL